MPTFLHKQITFFLGGVGRNRLGETLPIWLTPKKCKNFFAISGHMPYLAISLTRSTKKQHFFPRENGQTGWFKHGLWTNFLALFFPATFLSKKTKNFKILVYRNFCVFFQILHTTIFKNKFLKIFNFQIIWILSIFHIFFWDRNML